MKTLIKRTLIIAMLSGATFGGVIPKHRIPKNDDVIQVFDRSKESVLPSTFRFLVWNMYKGQNSTWAADFNLLSEEHDILATQEMYFRGEMKDIFENKDGFEFTTATSFFFDGKDRTGVATISRFSSSERNFQRSKYREPIVKSPKMVLMTTYQLENGQELLVANIHAINFVRYKKLEHQITETDQTIANHNGPVIFVGDFNTWSKKKQRAMRRILNKIGMTEARYPAGTDMRMKVFGRFIDYVWYKNLKLDKAKVLGNIRGAAHIPMSHTFSTL